MVGGRVLSTETKIYHRPGCTHAKRILYKNRMEMKSAEAKKYGYRPCKCCNNMNYLFRHARCNIDYFMNDKDMNYIYKDGVLYIRTGIGFWKLVYSKKEERIMLYHRNASDRPVDTAHPEKENYHRQTDCLATAATVSLLQYIYEHDRFREAQKRGVELTSYTSKKSRLLAERRKRREQHRRIDKLFAKLEEENKGYRELSYC